MGRNRTGHRKYGPKAYKSIHLLAYDLRVSRSWTNEQIAKFLGRCPKTIDNYIFKAEEEIRGSMETLQGRVALFGLVDDAVGVVRRYIQGNGDKSGGDLDAAFRVLESAGVMGRGRSGNVSDPVLNALLSGGSLGNPQLPDRDTGEPGGDKSSALIFNINQQINTAVTAVIPNNPMERDDFAHGAVGELRRIIGVISKSGPAGNAEKSSDS